MGLSSAVVSAWGALSARLAHTEEARACLAAIGSGAFGTVGYRWRGASSTCAGTVSSRSGLGRPPIGSGIEKRQGVVGP
jgi:hypothetical protein